MAEGTQTAGDADRVVVTGLGAVTAQGVGVAKLWEGVRAGQVAIRPVKNLPMDGYRTALGGEVQEPAIPAHPWPLEVSREPALDFALVAAEEAMAACGIGVDTAGVGTTGVGTTSVTGVGTAAGAGGTAGAAGAPVTLLPAQRWGVVLGSCNGGLVSGERALRDELAGRQPDWRHTLVVSPQAIAHATELIVTGQADAVLVGGTDAFSDVVFAGFNSLESLAVGPAAPYSKDRDGLSLGEGAGMLVLVRADIARAAGARVFAEVLGYGFSADGYHPTAPHPQGAGAARAITAALSRAGVAADEVGYVNGHGTGTPKNDPAESNAIRAALGEAAGTVALSSTKSMVGHLLGAAGAVESIVTILALDEQVAPPTAGFTGVDPQCGLDVVPNEARPLAMDVAVSNNFAFAGANASVVFGRPGRRAAAPAGQDRDRQRQREREPIVITGLAALTPAGTSVAELWEAYQAAGSASGADASQAAGHIGVGHVEFDPAAYLPARQRRRLDRLGLLAVASCQDALADAGLADVARPATGIGVILGTGLGPMESMERFTTPLLTEGPAAANPAVFPNTVYNAAAGQVAMLLGLTGVTSTVTAMHAAGAAALCVAADLLRAGAADAIVCPAVDVLPPAVVNAYRRTPLFAGAGGAYTLAEAGFALVLERLSVARARGARIRAVVRGHGIASDARGVGRWDARGRGVEQAVRTALAAAGVEPGALSAVWANAAGIRAVDRPERAALGRVFGPAGPRVETPKRSLGEPVGAGAHLSAVLAVAGWEAGGAAGPVLVNSSSLGGTHVSLVLTGPGHGDHAGPEVNDHVFHAADAAGSRKEQ
ncbi:MULTISPECIES: beta-ketoacyl-[acyl-carrier-protein] synthase family protein [Protofrankia]|uniref:Beta-ketoacyl-acyl-carrier-protein synthase II n=1 Tax=Candidatus Protofrankia datiscae TaxID=2716812 RepID=F8AXL3_9ACTN|nr:MULTISPECIES: beta-ketoacyl-[acyl-carrier-protein] synthase family protein [Protofrankia]AEH10364.1 Beta-ketoacyl-acyl-carrier-protein synthase II [Candidatus Protofrankia datiscae]